MCPHQNQFFCACAPVAGFRPEELPSPITLTVEDAPEMIRNVSGSSAGSCSSIDISESCNAFYLLPFSPGPCGATPKVSKPRPRSWSSPTPPQLPVDSSYLEFHRRGSDDLGDREVVAPDMLPNTAQPKAIGSSSAVFSTATPALHDARVYPSPDGRSIPSIFGAHIDEIPFMALHDAADYSVPYGVATTPIPSISVSAPPCTISHDVSIPFAPEQLSIISAPPNNTAHSHFTCDHIDCLQGNGAPPRFTRQYDLTRHKISVHGQPIFDCPWPRCRRKGEHAFRRNDHLTEHRRNVHEEDIPKRKNQRRRHSDLSVHGASAHLAL